MFRQIGLQPRAQETESFWVGHGQESAPHPQPAWPGRPADGLQKCHWFLPKTLSRKLFGHWSKRVCLEYLKLYSQPSGGGGQQKWPFWPHLSPNFPPNSAQVHFFGWHWGEGVKLGGVHQTQLLVRMRCWKSIGGLITAAFVLSTFLLHEPEFFALFPLSANGK